MNASDEIGSPPKRGRPAVGSGIPIQVRLQPGALEALDIWIAAQPGPKPSRPRAIRQLMKAGLEAMGFAAPDDMDATTLEERIGRIEQHLSKKLPNGPPSPETGMRMLRRGLAENKLRRLKQRKHKQEQ